MPIGQNAGSPTRSTHTNIHVLNKWFGTGLATKTPHYALRRFVATPPDGTQVPKAQKGKGVAVRHPEPSDPVKVPPFLGSVAREPLVESRRCGPFLGSVARAPSAGPTGEPHNPTTLGANGPAPPRPHRCPSLDLWVSARPGPARVLGTAPIEGLQGFRLGTKVRNPKGGLGAGPLVPLRPLGGQLHQGCMPQGLH